MKFVSVFVDWDDVNHHDIVGTGVESAHFGFEAGKHSSKRASKDFKSFFCEKKKEIRKEFFFFIFDLPSIFGDDHFSSDLVKVLPKVFLVEFRLDIFINDPCILSLKTTNAR